MEGLPEIARSSAEDSNSDDQFEWLETIDRDDCYMILDIQKPMKTLDFGAEGTTASVTTWHELLQLTDPDPYCGIVYVRGDFPDNAESVLARAQRRNQKGAFGLELSFPSDDVTLELSEAQGMINLRWPCTRFNVVRKGDELLFGSVTAATYTVCSFVKNHTLYQISRIAAPPRSSSISDGNRSLKPVVCKFTIGGCMRVGCAASNGAGLAGNSTPAKDNYTVVRPEVTRGKDNLLAFTSERHEKRVELRLWINGRQMQLQRREAKTDRISTPDDNGHPDYVNEIIDLAASIELGLPDATPIVLIAAISVISSHSAIDDDPKPAIASAEVEQFLGADNASISAPYRLWTNALDLPAESFELNAIGRSVEQIIGVSSVPFHGLSVDNKHPGGCPNFPALTRDSGSKSTNTLLSSASGSSTTGSKSDKTHNFQSTGKGIALVQNIMTPQLVDLGSALWQIRVLIRAIRFFNCYKAVSTDPRLPQHNTDLLTKERETYRGMLLSHVKGVCEWTLNIIPYLSSGRPRIVLPMAGILPCDIMPQISRARSCCIGPTVIAELPTQHDRHARRQKNRQHRDSKAKDQKWCCSLILWYIMCQCPSIYASAYMRERLWNCIETLSSFDGNDDERDARYADEPSVCFLLWYHNHSIMKLYEVLRNEDPSRFASLAVDFNERKKWVVEWHMRTEKSLGLLGRASGRLAQQSIDYEVANLALLGEEISVVNQARTHQYKSYLQQTKDLLSSRKETKILSPGRPDVTNWRPGDFRSVAPRPAPWELSCLNHLSSVSIGTSQDPRDELNNCQEFILGDYTFMATWDQSKIDSIGQWWDICTSSIMAAELLTEVCDRKSLKAPLPSASPTPSHPRSQSIDQGMTAGPDAAMTGKRIETPQHDPTPVQPQVPTSDKSREKATENTRKIYELIKEHWKDEDREGFTWTKRKPPRLYHADTSVQSLEDTPQVFELKQTRNVKIRTNFQKYLQKNNISIQAPNWSLATIEDDIPAEKLLHVSCFDLALQADGTEYPEIGILATRGRADFHDMKLGYKENNDCRSKTLVIRKDGTETDDTSLWLLYFLGKAHKHSDFLKFPLAWRQRLQDDRLRREDLKIYQRSLLMVLNDSMVDRSTKYRVLFIQKPTPIILQALVYMWHPDALDTFDDQLGNLSKSSNGYTQSTTILNDLKGRVDPGDVWITSINLSHWRLRSDQEKDLLEIEDGKDANKGAITDFPPKNVSDKRTLAEEGHHHLLSINEMSMSLVFTGDRMGRCWTCTIMCELIEESAMSTYIIEIMKIQQMFIHQQYAGRALCFLLLLGYMCQSLAIECESFAEELDKIMGMEAMVLLKGLEWHKSDIALRKLKQIVWGLEALRVFDDKLKMALAKIKESEEAMKKDLERGENIRHRDMVKNCSDVIHEFEKRQGRLENAHSSIQQRIEQCGRLSDGITSVVGIEQNENIGMLTWINIVYLPLAFIAGIFSMGHGIVPDDASWGTFIWVIAAFIITTIVCALSLQTILATLRRWVKDSEKAVKTKLTSRREPDAEKVKQSSSTGIPTFEMLRSTLSLRKRSRGRPEDQADIEMANQD